MAEITMQEEEDAKVGAAAAKAVTVTKRGKMKFKHKLLLIILSLLMMGIFRTGFMFIIIGLLPSIVAYYMDVTNQHYRFKAILACNLCGMMQYIAQMLHSGPSSAVLQAIMGSASTWAIIYGSALIGWLLTEICPIIAQVMVSSLNQAQISHITHVQKKIEGEWGPEVTQLSGDPHTDDD